MKRGERRESESDRDRDRETGSQGWRRARGPNIGIALALALALSLPPSSATQAQSRGSHAVTRFSVNGIMTPRRKRVTCPVLDETTSEMHSAAIEMAAAAAWREPRPLGSEWL
jgi:hypothetical protein